MELATLADVLVRRSVWIVGGDGWAYDIGFGGLDHVLTTGRDVNILVLDTGVYSNTGGQASKATPRAAVAKFAADGKAAPQEGPRHVGRLLRQRLRGPDRDGGQSAQTLKAFHEAESYHGPSLILAYSQCIAHGINMTHGMTHQKDVVQSGLWPLYRYDPRLAHGGRASVPSGQPQADDAVCRVRPAGGAVCDGVAGRIRSDAEQLMALAQKDIDDQWHYYEQMAGVEREIVARMGRYELCVPT